MRKLAIHTYRHALIGATNIVVVEVASCLWTKQYIERHIHIPRWIELQAKVLPVGETRQLIHHREDLVLIEGHIELGQKSVEQVERRE